MAVIPEVLRVPVAKLRKADWNYKVSATDAQVDKLMASIKADGSAGVLAVRRLDDGELEVIDGNHRLDAVVRLGWEEVWVENFGALPLSAAVLVARRRNYEWFEDDVSKLAALYRDHVLSDFDAETLDRIMPEGFQGIESLIASLDFEWKDPLVQDSKNLSFPLTPDLERLWAAWAERSTASGVMNRTEQLCAALTMALGVEQAAGEAGAGGVQDG